MNGGGDDTRMAVIRYARFVCVYPSPGPISYHDLIDADVPTTSAFPS